MIKEDNFCKKGYYAHLPSRSVILVSGDDHISFLQGLLSNDLDLLKEHRVIYGCLLTPQGKILFDLFLWTSEDGILIDIASCFSESFLRRLQFYRLRSSVFFSDISSKMHVYGFWGGGEFGNFAPRDPRHRDIGFRCVTSRENLEGISPGEAWQLVDESLYSMHLFQLGISDSEYDIMDSGLFVHEANMDLLSGVSFTKGCYIGQEVVSRMSHRGFVRKRLTPLRSTFPFSNKGTPLFVGETRIGHVSSFFPDKIADGLGKDFYISLGLLRLDRLGDDCVVSFNEHKASVFFPAWHPGLLHLER